jgi:hypothetical protein
MCPRQAHLPGVFVGLPRCTGWVRRRGCISARGGDNAAMARRPLLLLVVALVPAVTIAVALLSLTFVREQARRQEAARNEEAQRQEFIGSQQLAALLHAAHQQDREHQQQAQEREHALQEHINALTLSLAQSQEALRTSQEQLTQVQARVRELMHPAPAPPAKTGTTSSAAP